MAFLICPEKERPASCVLRLVPREREGDEEGDGMTAIRSVIRSGMKRK